MDPRGMMSGVVNPLAATGPPTSQGNPMHLSWTNSNYPPNFLNAGNILEYFCNVSNPFYDHTCNNETLRMQRLPVERLNTLKGIQFVLYKAEEPLFVIRKVDRHSPNEVTPLADYYIISGVVYQAPNLNAVVTSRILAATISLRDSFKEALNYSNYHPSKGYWWNFGKQDKSKSKKEESEKTEKKKSEKTQARTTLFQKERVDILLGQLSERFPINESAANKERIPNIEISDEVKSEAGGSSVHPSEGFGGKRSAAAANLGSGGSVENNPAKRAKPEPS